MTNGWTPPSTYIPGRSRNPGGAGVKNGSLSLSSPTSCRWKAVSKLDAIRGAAMIRLRPVLMTTAATIAGHFPLTLVAGRSGGRNSIGLVLVGGMFVGTMFTLFIIPSIYMLIARDHRQAREREAAVAAAEVS